MIGWVYGLVWGELAGIIGVLLGRKGFKGDVLAYMRVEGDKGRKVKGEKS